MDEDFRAMDAMDWGFLTISDPGNGILGDPI
jgi:hypothetical protein